jgi:hypothetical protein
VGRGERGTINDGRWTITDENGRKQAPSRNIRSLRKEKEKEKEERGKRKGEHNSLFPSDFCLAKTTASHPLVTRD